jgi:DNA-3-methyladenine glycosylase
MTSEALPRGFFVAEPLDVARRLVGQRVVRRIDGAILAGRIVEVEAYGGREDTTSHASRGANGRAAGMFGQVGRAYVYLIYGIHSCLNVVAHADGAAGAVLIRALAPEEGVEHMGALRGGAAGHLIASGPGRLCRAMAIDRALDGLDLCDPAGPLFIASGPSIPDIAVSSSVRVGVVGRPDDILLPWRLYITDDPNVSPGRRG